MDAAYLHMRITEHSFLLFYRKPDRMDINKDTESIRLNKIGLKKAFSEGSAPLADR